MLGERRPLGDIKPAEKNINQLPSPDQEKVNVSAFLARLNTSDGFQKQSLFNKQDVQSPVSTNFNHENKSNSENEEGKVRVKAFLSRISSKPSPENQEYNEDNELEFTVCHGSIINGDTVNKGKQDRRSLYKPEDIDLTVCRDRVLSPQLESATSLSSPNSSIMVKNQNSRGEDESGDDVTAAMDLTGCLSTLQETLSSDLNVDREKNTNIKTLALRRASCAPNVEGLLKQNLCGKVTDEMDMTTCLENVVESDLPGANTYIGNVKENGVLGERSSQMPTLNIVTNVCDMKQANAQESPSMDMTCCIGNFQQLNSPRIPTKRESLAMDMTVNTGNFQECNFLGGQSPISTTSARKTITGVGNEYQSNARGRQSSETEFSAMDVTSCIGNVEQSNLERQGQSSRKSLGMDMTCIDTLEHLDIPPNTTSKNMSFGQDISGGYYTDNAHLTMRRQQSPDFLVCAKPTSETKPLVTSEADDKTVFVELVVDKLNPRVANKNRSLIEDAPAEREAASLLQNTVALSSPIHNPEDLNDNQLPLHNEMQEYHPVTTEDPEIHLSQMNDATLKDMESKINNSLHVFRKKLTESFSTGKLLLPELPAYSQRNTQPVSKLCSQFGRKRTIKHSPFKETSLKSYTVGSDLTHTVEENDKAEVSANFSPCLPKIAKLENIQEKKEALNEKGPKQIDSQESSVCEGVTSILEESLIKMNLTQEPSAIQAERCSDDVKGQDSLDHQQSDKGERWDYIW